MKNGSVLRELRKFERDSSWIHRRFEDLRKRYPNELIAVRGGKIIAHAKSVPELHAKVRRLNPRLVGKVAIEFLPKEDQLLIL